MKISETWLRSYVNPPLDTAALVAQITMAGLEVDSVEAAAAVFSGVVVGEVLAMEQHPDADRLRVCQVNVGEAEALQIVCGAANVRVGLKIPAALIGAVLPEDFKIKKSKLRGVESFGMLCSEKELGLAADAHGLMELPNDAPVGVDIRDYLSLNDSIIEVDLTPNRADCLSVEGIAREVAVLNKIDWSPNLGLASEIHHDESLTVTVQEPAACPRYLGRLIKGVNPQAETPLWLQEGLRRSGLRSLGAVIDVTNYVLIELGQPLHAFDANQVEGGITVRYAQQSDEKFDGPLTLLNGLTLGGKKLAEGGDTLVIADDKKLLALAGVMGGCGTEIGENTVNIFLECAFFTPLAIAGKARQYGLHTDSSHRFERGVDFTLQRRAIERATQLIVEIAGGSVGAITEVTSIDNLPKRDAVILRRQRIEKTLGVAIADELIVGIFQRLGLEVTTLDDGWSVKPSGARFDIAIEADLIEEIARIYGYNNLPNSSLLMRSQLGLATESVLELDRVKDLLVDRGYQEAITYSFVDEAIQKIIAPDDELVRLKNPISADMAVMRTTLWCGLLTAALHNTNRQHNRVRLFETGLRFVQKDGETQQQKMLAGLALGDAHAEQWGEKTRKVDFFDVKADVQALFALTAVEMQFVPAEQAALHPYQTAEILDKNGQSVGWIGMLHPNLEKQLGFDTQVFLFELAQDLVLNKTPAKFKPLSKYPSVRRDLALLVDDNITASQLIDCIKSCNEAMLQEVVIFDIYRGKGVAEGSKSVALSLTLQNDVQTLTDLQIDAIVSTLLDTLARNTGAKLRD